MRHRLKRPNLNCSNCFTVYKKTQKAPECFHPVGCSVEHLTSDIALNALVDGFLGFHRFSQIAGASPLIEKLIRSFPLLGDPWFVLELEMILESKGEDGSSVEEQSAFVKTSSIRKMRQSGRL